MTDQEIAQAAAKRWGQKDPCPADVINEHVPTYGRRWRRIETMVHDLAVPEQRCEYCGGVLHGKGTRRYCDGKCNSLAWRDRNQEADQREARRSA